MFASRACVKWWYPEKNQPEVNLTIGTFDPNAPCGTDDLMPADHPENSDPNVSMMEAENWSLRTSHSFSIGSCCPSAFA
jgi:hypothetical protein